MEKNPLSVINPLQGGGHGTWKPFPTKRYVFRNKPSAPCRRCSTQLILSSSAKGRVYGSTVVACGKSHFRRVVTSVPKHEKPAKLCCVEFTIRDDGSNSSRNCALTGSCRLQRLICFSCSPYPSIPFVRNSVQCLFTFCCCSSFCTLCALLHFYKALTFFGQEVNCQKSDS